MLTYRHTDTAPKPFSAYSQSVEVPADMRTLHVSGQVGVGIGVGEQALRPRQRGLQQAEVANPVGATVLCNLPLMDRQRDVLPDPDRLRHP